MLTIWTCSLSFGHDSGCLAEGMNVTMPELIAWMHAALVIERAQQMARLTLRHIKRKLQKLLPGPPSLKMLPPPK